MQEIIRKLAELLKVKTIVTFAVVAIFSVMALKGQIQPDNVIIIVSMVVSFYFGTQHEKTAPTVPRSQPPVSTIGTVSESSTYGETSPVDAATYNQTHPDTAA